MIPQLSQEDIRDVFGVGQKVLVRDGTAWRTHEILGITVLRHDVYCTHCGMPLLGEPRFWFKGLANFPLEDIIALEDIDPKLRPIPNLIHAKPSAIKQDLAPMEPPEK
ncbi:hypothetical protein ES703_60305 [subsurface metagenome]